MQRAEGCAVITDPPTTSFPTLLKMNIPLRPTNSDICQKTTNLFQIALTPKGAGLVWPFFKQNICLGQVNIY